MGTTLWRICLLGGLTLEREGQPPITRFRSRKTAALLAYLALYPRQHTRESLTDLFWPDVPLEQGQQSLRSSLASLRRQLEPPGVRSGTVLEAGRLQIALNREAFVTDAAEFVAAVRRGDIRRARTLYTGPLLPEFYEDWAVFESERYRDMFERLTVAETPVPSSPTSPETMDDVAPEAERVAVPLLLDRFFGRDEELARLLALPAAWGGLTTLLGPGGSGKTRLAVETARRWPGTVWFVQLADCIDPEEAPERIATAVGLAGGARSALERIGDGLRAAPGSLLVLDNLEQIAGIILAGVVAALRRAAPSSRILATSRQRLVVPGEQLVAVVPLALPRATGGEEISAAELVGLAQTPSVALFVDRAQSCRADFQITPRNADAVVALVTLLEGVPLALELAASWVGIFTPRQMYERLSETFGWLEARQPVAEKAGRHRSLWAVASWSYTLLGEDLRTVFRRLSVFPGGATLEAAQEVCELAAGDALSRLLERSLVRSVPEDDALTPRFTLPEALREFAAERCAAEEDDTTLRLRHQHYFQNWLTEQNREQASIIVEMPNLMAAQQYAGRCGEFAAQIVMVRALWRPLYHAGAWEQGERLLAEGRAAAEQIGDSRALADFGMAGATFAFLRADYPAARRAKEEAARYYAAIGAAGRAAKARADAGAIALVEGEVEFGIRTIEPEIPALRADPELKVPCLETLQNLGIAYLRRNGPGDLDRAGEYISEALARAEEVGSAGTIAYCQMALGDVALMRGDAREAEARYTAAADGLRRDRMEHRLVEALSHLSMVLLEQGRTDDARPVLIETLETARRLGLRETLVVGVEGTSDWLFRQERSCADAARLWGVAEATRKALPLHPPPALDVFMLRMDIHAGAAPRDRRAGRKLTLEQGAALALEILRRSGP